MAAPQAAPAVMALVDDTIGREGRYTNDRNDSGGATCWGITEFVARANGYTGDMAQMPRATAVDIYLTRYWTAPGFAKVFAVSPNLAITLFDIGANMGPATGVKFVQRALNVLNRGGRDWPDVQVDGGLGVITLAAMGMLYRTRPAGREMLHNMVRAQRTVRYIEIAEGNPSQEDFENGWQGERAFV